MVASFKILKPHTYSYLALSLHDLLQSLQSSTELDCSSRVMAPERSLWLSSPLWKQTYRKDQYHAKCEKISVNMQFRIFTLLMRTVNSIRLIHLFQKNGHIPTHDLMEALSKKQRQLLRIVIRVVFCEHNKRKSCIKKNKQIITQFKIKLKKKQCFNPAVSKCVQPTWAKWSFKGKKKKHY